MAYTSTYRKNILSLFGTEMGNKLLLLLDPGCDPTTATGCDMMRACQTLTTLKKDPLNDYTLLYKGEDGIEHQILLNDTSLSSISYDTATSVLTVHSSDSSTKSVSLAPLFTAVNSDSVSLNYSSGVLSAVTIVDSVTAGNSLVINSNGLYAPSIGVDSISGTGTINKVAKFTSETTIGDGLIDDNGTSVRNTGAGNIASNTAFGLDALISNTTGANNTANGNQALRSNTTGGNNTANGLNALYSNTTGANNTALGYNTRSGNFNGSVILGANAIATASNQFVVGSVGTVAGAVGTVATPQSRVWNVVINGVAEQILLA